MDAKKQSEAFDSIHQKSMELSIDQNHQISRLEHGSFCDLDSMKNTTEMIQQHQASNNAAHAQSIASAHVGGKMIELEQRIKSKFSNIKSLESLLDSILGKQRDQQALLPQLVGDANSLQKVFMNIRRAVSKLKIELHQDYLQLGQVNLHFQVPGSVQNSTASVRVDQNASMTLPTFDLPNQNSSQQEIRLQQLAHLQQQSQQPFAQTSFNQVSQLHAPLRSGSNQYLLNYQQRRDSGAMTIDSGSQVASGQGISSYSSMPQMQPMQIGSTVLQSQPASMTAREPVSPTAGTPVMMYPLQQQLSSSGMPPHPTSTSRPRLHMHHTSMGNPSPSHTANNAAT